MKSTFFFEHKTFKTLRSNTEKVLRRLTLVSYSAMNEELDIKDDSARIVMCRYGATRKIIGWTIMDSYGCCQIYVDKKYRKSKIKESTSISELLVLELLTNYNVKGHYVHDEPSTRFWSRFKTKYPDYSSILNVYEDYE